MSTCRPTAVIFDLDGTLIDSVPGIEYSVKEAFAACGIEYPSVNLRSMIGPPIRTILSRVANTVATDVLTKLENSFRTSYDSQGWQRSYCYPEVETVLGSMHDSGIRLFVATNKPRHISERILEMRGIEQLFEGIVTRDSRTPHYCNKEEMLRTSLDLYGLKARECLFIGDTEEDAESAAASGMYFGYVSHGYGTVDERNEVPVHLRLNEFSQLPQLIGLEFAHDR